jgi:LPXTG-motif cell wall-anchored protein
VSGIGTFKPREVCPGHGGGHDDDGHDDDHDGGHGTSSADLAAEDEGEGGREPCAHLVVNQQAPTPTIPTTTPTTAPAPPPTDPPGSDVRDAGADRSPDPVPTGTGTLARTGSDPMPLALVGLGALLLGSAVLGARRQRLSRT